MKLSWALACVCLATTLGAVWTLSCKDDAGNDVDWWYLYKMPKNSSQPDPSVATGYAYNYVLSTGSSSSWIMSPELVTSATSMPGRTLAPMYTSSRTNYIYVLYNDEHPDGTTSSSRGHTKGVILADQTQGIWLVQSTPKYPPVTQDGYSYPDTGDTYGQSFLCITFNTATVANTIGNQLQYNIPSVYDSNMPSWSQSVAPDLYNYVVSDTKVTAAPWSNIASFSSSGGQPFTSYAKHTNYGLDLYYDLVAPDIKSALDVETWNHGSDDLPSECTGYAVYNVMQVSNSVVGYSFTTGSDHSKWGAAPTGSPTAWICVGDINRAASQESRAGGTVCSINPRPWTAFSSSVVAFEPC